jgi:hypothetical protein
MCRTSRAGTGPGGDIRRTRVQAAKDRVHAMRIWRASGTARPRHCRVDDALPYVPGRKGPLSSRSVEQCGHEGLCPSRDGSLGGTVSPQALKYIGRRGLRPSRRAFTRPILPVAEDGDSPGWPELQHERGTVGRAPPWESPNQGYSAAFSSLGGTASSRSARKARPRTLLRNLQRDSNGQCPCELRQVGRDGVPALRKNVGHRGLSPSQTSSNRGHPSTLACPVGAASSRSARKSRPRTLLRNLQRDSNGQCPCELRQVGRDGAPAVRRNVGRRGPCPSCAIATLPGRCGIARPGRPASWRSAGRRL